MSRRDVWHRDGLVASIDAALTEAGLSGAPLSIDDLAPLDQFHGGGKPATVRLARLAGLAPGARVLDVGGGLGGPARTLAVEFGCRVTTLDRTASYVEAARLLTQKTRLADHVSHLVGDACALPFEDAAFDVVWTQNSGMGIADKERLYAGFARVLRAGGLLALQEPMAGPHQPPYFPLIWARDASENFLVSQWRMRDIIAAAGFCERAWEDVTADTGTARTATVAGRTIQAIVMGADLAAIGEASKRNRDEGRTLMVQAVFERT